jgi:5'-3' exonuclease
VQAQFIDMCILCGCDYCGTIRGIGPKSSYKLIQQHGTLEKVLAALDKTKFTIPEPFPFEARAIPLLRIVSHCLLLVPRVPC